MLDGAAAGDRAAWVAVAGARLQGGGAGGVCPGASGGFCQASWFKCCAYQAEQAAKRSSKPGPGSSSVWCQM